MLRDRDLRFPIAAIENESVVFFPCPCFLFHKHRRELRTPTGLGPFQNKGIRFWYFRSIWVTKVFFWGGEMVDLGHLGFVLEYGFKNPIFCLF
jgi:hypothetical protein